MHQSSCRSNCENGNAILSRHGEPPRLSARQIGTILNHMGFPTKKVDAAGRGIYLLNGECSRIHNLATDYGLPSVQEQFPACPYCHPSEGNAHVNKMHIIK